MAASYRLGQHLDSVAAPLLAQDLLDLRGADLQVDAEDVSFIGTLAMQVLVAARRQWEADGHGFRVAPVADGVRAASDGLGIDLAAIGAETCGPAEGGARG